MADSSLPVALGLGGLGALFLVSGFTKQPLADVLNEGPRRLQDGETSLSPETGGPAVNGNPILPANCHSGSAFPCGPYASTLRELEELAKSRFGLTITATNNGVHVPGSYHYMGRAFDCAAAGGRTKEGDAFAKYVEHNYGSQLLELFYMPLGIAIKNGKTIPFSISGETCSNCIHVAM